MNLKTILFAVAAALAGTQLAAQSFEEVMSAAQADVGEISQYQQALQNPDPRFQYALVQQMLKLPDPALQRIAKEHALFSTNPVMRQAAIKAILDSGATLRLQLAADQSTVPRISNWVARMGGTYVENQGQVLIKTPDAVSDACWGTADRCIFRLVGNTLQFTPRVSNDDYYTATFDLGNDGVLRGNMSYRNSEFAQAQIDIKQ